MRVCHLISSYWPVVGGAETATRSLCETLHERGVDVVVLTRRRRGASAVEIVDGVAVRRVGLPLSGKIGSLTFGVSSIMQLVTRLRRYRIVHVQSLDTPLLVGFIMRALGRKLVSTIHGEAMIAMQARTRAGRLRLRLMRGAVHRFTAITGEVAARLRADGVSATRITNIPNGVDTSRFRPATTAERSAVRSGLGVGDHVSTAMFVGRLIPLKQVDLLLRAWKEAMSGSDSRLLVAGDGPELGPLKGLVEVLGVDGVEFLGRRNDIEKLLAAADLFVLPSSQEGLSMALLESMAAGVPPLVSDLPGHRSLIRHAVNGWLFPVGDQEILSALLAEALTAVPGDKSQGRAARRTIQERFSLGEAVRHHVSMYDALQPAS